MSEQCEDIKYIKCSKCKCKYINDDEHIKDDFGYNRLNERYKTCLTCRTKKREYNKCWSSNNYHYNRDIELERKRIYRKNNIME